MRFKGPIAAAVAIALVVGSLFVFARDASSQARVTAKVLFDLADGEYFWSELEIDDPNARNATWDAVLAAATRLGIDVEWSWFPLPLGAAIRDLGNRDPPADFVGLYRWNGSAAAWEFADVGISTLVVRQGDALALYNGAFGGEAFEPRFPTPTPTFPFPLQMFRGDLANRGVARTSGPGTARILWDANLVAPEIGSTPAVAHGRLYVTTLRGLVALDADTGAVAWKNEPVKGFSSPTVFNGIVIVGSSDGRLYAVDATTGTERWNTSLIAQPAFSGITSSPKVSGDHVYVGTFNESGGAGEVIALWVRDGTLAWRHSTASVHFSSPAATRASVYIGVMGTYNVTQQIAFDPPYGVLALDARTGQEKWFFPSAGSVAASPVLAGSFLLAPSKDPAGDGLVYAIDPLTGIERWRAEVPAGVSSPALQGETLYVGGGSFGQGGRVTALNVTDGRVLWTFISNGPVQASMTYAGGRLYFSTNTAEGTIYALDGSNGRVVWTFTPSPTQYILGSPVVANGTLYAPSDNGHIYAFRDFPASGPLGLTPTQVALVITSVGVVAVIVAVIVQSRRRRRAP